MIGGDALVKSISAASILAKVTRDRMLLELHQTHPVYGFIAHAGYGTPQHLAALREHGPCEHHRRSFAPVREAHLRFGTGVPLPAGEDYRRAGNARGRRAGRCAARQRRVRRTQRRVSSKYATANVAQSPVNAAVAVTSTLAAPPAISNALILLLISHRLRCL